MRGSVPTARYSFVTVNGKPRSSLLIESTDYDKYSENLDNSTDKGGSLRSPTIPCHYILKVKEAI